MTKGKKIATGIGAALLATGLFVWFGPVGDAVRDVMEVTDLKEVQNDFKGDTTERLKALYAAADSYHGSEEMFPNKEKWMDDLMPRLKTSDLKEGEAEKKLVRPEFDGKAGKFGFALNQAVAGKFRKDIPDPKSLLFFESVNTDRNFSGDPTKDAKKPGKAVTIDGTIVEL